MRFRSGGEWLGMGKRGGGQLLFGLSSSSSEDEKTLISVRLLLLGESDPLGKGEELVFVLQLRCCVSVCAVCYGIWTGMLLGRRHRWFFDYRKNGESAGQTGEIFRRSEGHGSLN